ncbi:MAG: hypothetical protein QN773_11540, partial [Nitrososphaeraceae archaeon]|nr:hypothetical protein [Nitrososphaeraceae archaeon]
TDAIVSAAKESIPQIKSKRRIKILPYWDNNCDQTVKARNRAQRKARVSKDPEDAMNYRRLRGIAQRTIKNSSQNCWENYCNSLNSDTKISSVWHMSKKFVRK